MAKNRTKEINDWKSLIDFVESINQHKKTIVLSGWTNYLYKGKLYIKSLVFTTKSVNILGDINGKDSTKSKAEGKETSTTSSKEDS